MTGRARSFMSEIAGAASFHHLGMRDQGGEATLARRRELVDLIRRLGANLLTGHGPGDYHSDHRRRTSW